MSFRSTTVERTLYNCWTIVPQLLNENSLGYEENNIGEKRK